MNRKKNNYKSFVHDQVDAVTRGNEPAAAAEGTAQENQLAAQETPKKEGTSRRNRPPVVPIPRKHRPQDAIPVPADFHEDGPKEEE